MGAFAAVAAVSVAVAAVPAAAQQGSQSYPDVASDAYYAQAVEALGSRGVFEGTECGEGFCPHQPLPRWQMGVWLVRALEEAEPEATVSRFADVESDFWWMPYADRLAELEITVGCRREPLRYCPDRPVSRAQMASFLARAFDLPAAESAGFADVDSQTNVHGQNIDRLAASEITVGCRTEPLSYCPSRSVTRAQMAAFIYRGLDWRAAQTQDDDLTQEQPEFITEENDVSRWVKRGLIDEYGDKWPWLKEVWDYTNREDFKYLIGGHPSASTRGLRPAQTGDVFNLIVGFAVSLTTYDVDNLSSLSTPVHELAHIYTLSHGAASNPAPVAVAYLYFDQLAQDVCLPWELYAETASSLDAGFNPDEVAFNWHQCGHLPSSPTTEAITVVRQAFSGQMPDWFYETFQNSDGSLDYAQLWTAVKDSGRRGQNTVLPMLRHSFGGYCSEQAIWDTLFSLDRYELPQIVQPWRDGGC